MRKSINTIMFLLMTGSVAYAQKKGDYPAWQRISLGYGKHFTNTGADFSFTNRNDNLFTDRTTIRSGKSTVIQADIYIPLGRLSERAVVALNAGISYSNTTFTHDSVLLTTHPLKKDVAAKVYGIPLSLDFKIGADAAQNRTYGTMFTAGIGVQPSFVQSEGFVSEGSESIEKPFKSLSFIKLEGGFFAGVAFKLRAMAYFGQITYIDRTEVVTGDLDGKKGQILGYRKTNAVGPYGYVVSLIIMPTSFGWKRD